MLRSVAQVIQLTYQPAFDPFHATFRFLRLRQAVLNDASLPRDHLRILDFYLLFPFRVDDVRLFQRHRKFRKLAQQFAHTRPYGELPDDRVLFHRMGSIQGAALDTLANKRLLKADDYSRGLVSSTDEPLPSPLLAKVQELNAQQGELIEFLRALAAEYELLGPNGLKDRTGLLEHAYDAA